MKKKNKNFNFLILVYRKNMGKNFSFNLNHSKTTAKEYKSKSCFHNYHKYKQGVE